MAAVTKGTAHLFGIQAGVGAIGDATVLSFNLDEEHANVATTINEIGNEIEDRRDDLHKTGTITLKIRAAYTELDAADQITYDSVIYLITKKGRVEQAGDFLVITYSIKTTEYVTLS